MCNSLPGDVKCSTSIHGFCDEITEWRFTISPKDYLHQTFFISVGLCVCLFLCLSVCLFVCQHHWRKACERIFMNFLEYVGYATRNNMDYFSGCGVELGWVWGLGVGG